MLPLARRPMMPERRYDALEKEKHIKNVPIRIELAYQKTVFAAFRGGSSSARNSARCVGIMRLEKSRRAGRRWLIGRRQAGDGNRNG